MESGQSNALLEGALCICISPHRSDQNVLKQDTSGQSRSYSHSSMLAKSRMVHRPFRPVHCMSTSPSSNSEDAETNVFTPVPSLPLSTQPSRLEVIARSNQERGFSEEVSKRLSVSQRKSTSEIYESKWRVFREWCQCKQINPCSPTVPNIADFLLYLFEAKKLSVSTIKGYRSSLSQVLSSGGLDISINQDLNNLIKGFSIERPITHRQIPRWDLNIVLRHIMREPYEPMATSSIASLTKKTAFLLTLATAKRNSEVWAFSANVSFGADYQSATLSFLPGFLAKTYDPSRPDTQLEPVTIPALAPSMGPDLPDRTLCPVRALRFYLKRTQAGLNPKRPHRLLIAHKLGHSGDITKHTVSGWIKSTIRSAYMEVRDSDLPHLTHTNFQARELRAYATTLAFNHHHSLKQVMSAASWRRGGTFAQFYLRDVSQESLTLDEPIVAGQATVMQCCQSN